MTTATLISRMSKVVKCEASTAANKIELDGYTVDFDNRCIIDESGSYYTMLFYRNGNEVIAIPDFYLFEGDGSIFFGSKNNRYELNGDTLTLED